MTKWLGVYFAMLVAFLACDSVWLTLTASRLYRAQLGDMLLEKFVVAPAVAFYLIYLFALMVLAVEPSRAGPGWYAAIPRGALFGFAAYATYDLTNQATLRGWSGTVTLADLAWGTVISAIGATVGLIAARKLIA